MSHALQKEFPYMGIESFLYVRLKNCYCSTCRKNSPIWGLKGGDNKVICKLDHRGLQKEFPYMGIESGNKKSCEERIKPLAERIPLYGD